MVARSEDKPRTIHERVIDATSRLDEVNRALGRGSEALRNSAGHILNLNPDSAAPLLVPQQTDTGLKFTDGRLEITDATGSELRDLRVRRLIGGDVALLLDTSTAYITDDDADGFRALQAGDVFAHGNVLVDGRVRGNVGAPGDGYSTYGTHFGNVASGGAATTIEGGNHLGNTATFTNSIGATTLVYGGRVEDVQGNVRVAPACERRLKNHVRDLDDPLAVVEKWRPAVSTWADDTIREQRGGDPFAAVYVDEVADTAPEAVYDRGDGTRTTDDRGLLAYLTGAIQQLAADNRALTARVMELEAQQ